MDNCKHGNTITNECSDCNEQELFDDMLDYTLAEIRDILYVFVYTLYVFIYKI